MIEENELPEGWVWTTIGAVAKTTSGGTPSRNHPEYYVGDIPWVKSGELNDGVIKTVEGFLSEDGLKYSSAKVFPQDTAVVALYGATVGKTGILGLDAATNQAICAIFPLKDAFSSKFITYWLQSQRQTLIDQSLGGAQPNISQEIVRAFPFPLASLAEQSHIVAAIEQQFTRLDAGVASLQRAKAKLKRYRAAVLKAAVEGKLTEEWRAEHPTTETASVLLERILKERRVRWESDLRVKGKDPAKVKYVEPAEADVEGLPELPEGWCWGTIRQVAECLDYIRKPINKEERAKRAGTIPYYGANGQVGWIDEYIFDEPLVLVVEDETFIGREIPFSYKITGKAWVNNHAHILRPTSVVHVDYLNYSLAHYPFTPLTQGTTGRRKLTQNALMIAPYALPPLAEQEQIVAEVERLLSVISQLEITVDVNLKRAERLRQSILREAFAGRLVPQDPDDEPASVLLERIRGERVGGQERKKGSRGADKNKRRPVPAEVPEPVTLDTGKTEQVALWE